MALELLTKIKTNQGTSVANAWVEIQATSVDYSNMDNIKASYTCKFFNSEKDCIAKLPCIIPAIFDKDRIVNTVGSFVVQITKKQVTTYTIQEYHKIVQQYFLDTYDWESEIYLPF